MKTILDFTAPWQAGAARLQHGFGVPEQVLQAHRPEDVPAVLEAVQQAAEQGLWCVGWLAYEAAAAFDRAYADAVHGSPSGQPLAWFGLHRAPLAMDVPPRPQQTAAVHWQTALSRAQFDAHVARIHAAIAAGDCYQINYTAPLTAELGALQHGDAGALAQALFARLQQAQPGGYAALVDSGDIQVLSLSPELFFDWDGERILTRPMKGTAARGKTPQADAQAAQTMRESVKERAENVMIVDLLRNDLSRIAVPHSVKVPQLFQVQALPAVWQMTSDVVARTRPDVRLVDVFAALFPCGSITGAPKRQAMRLIRELEPEPRGVYCGALGVVRPGAGPRRIHASFNVPIRTVVLKNGRLSCGIGSGITASANAADEWMEWQHKQAFLKVLEQGVGV
ncbi:aminodeoxychorismate synthase component I [Comamonas testosteroni]|uniref:Para-aminobenzoate synthase, subunit I n=2 Tax=Comamonas testosteroni TaxID=285 RepID=B7WVH8_COMTK|nr:MULTISPECIES: aminodeoxychorismate synthase component I [Comamonas]AIJ48753.1 para-aminobenzoate synthase [Comamonas testosteroni TK102]EED65770.1 para-aminobenzoate synthase, subunit I [Comamonas testosteroni KF-1]MPS90762.1 aminodeoxychorismate synthase component I [Comamonas sp.]TYK69280.1 aminodeoxychorismate synthase component I [Comamonas sp. Z3]WQG69166.1 aminodeoxychorismate synthase component I [Comamonas testosteroni]